MAFGRGSMTKEMVGGTKAKPAKKMALGGPIPSSPGADPRRGPPGRGPGGPGGMAPPPPSPDQAAQMAFIQQQRGAGAPTSGGLRGFTPPPPPGAAPVVSRPMAPGGAPPMKAAVPGMKKGGKVKMNSGGTAGLGDAMKQKVDAMGTRMNKGGKVGGRGDGVAIKGKTKGCMC